MPREHDMSSNGNSVLTAILATVGAGLAMGLISAFQGHASDEDLKEVEIEVAKVEKESIKRDEELEKKLDKLVDMWVADQIAQANFRADVKAKLKIKE